MLYKAAFANGAKHRLRRFNRQRDAFQVCLKRSKMPSERFLPIRRGGCSAVPILDQQTENRAAAKRKKSAEKKTRKPSLCLAKKRGKIRRKKTRFLGRKMGQKKRVFSYLDNTES